MSEGSLSSRRAVSSEATTLTPPSARRPLATPTTRTRWPLMVALPPMPTPSLSRSARSTITASGVCRRLRRCGGRARENMSPFGPGLMPETNTDTPPVPRGAPVAVDPQERLNAGDLGIHVQQRGHVGRDRAALVHALGARVSDPDVGARAGDVDRGATEDAQHQRGLQQLQQAGEADRQHRRQEAPPLVDQRLAGQGDHQRALRGGRGRAVVAFRQRRRAAQCLVQGDVGHVAVAAGRCQGLLGARAGRPRP